MNSLLTKEQRNLVLQNNPSLLERDTLDGSLLTQDQYEFVVAQNQEIFNRPVDDSTLSLAMKHRKPMPLTFGMGERNLLKDAAMELSDPPINGTDEEWAQHAEQSVRKRQANRMVNVINYQMHNDPKKALELAQISRELGINYNITPEQASLLTSRFIAKEYEETVNEFGMLPDEIMEDPNFIKYVGADDYMYFVGLRDKFEELNGTTGFFEGIDRRIDLAAAQRDLELKFNENEIDLNTFETQSFINQYKYARPSDGVFEDAAQVVYDMVAPLYHNLGSISLGAVYGGFAGAGFGSVIPGAGTLSGAITGAAKGAIGIGSIAIGNETFNRYRAQIAIEAMRKDPNLTQEQALEAATEEALIMMGLDFTGDAIGIGIFGKAGSKLANGIKKRFLKKGAYKETAQAFETRIASRILGSSKEAFKDFAGIWGSEVLTEGMQGAVQQYAVNDITGAPLTQDMLSTAWENMQQAGKVMLLFGLVGATPRFINTYMDIGHAAARAQYTKNAIERAEMVKEADITKRDPETATTLFNKIFNGRTIYINASHFKEYLDNEGIPYTTLPRKFRNLDTIVAENPNARIEMTEAELFVKYYTSPNGGALIRYLRTEPDGMTMEDAATVFKGIMPLEETIAQIRAEREAMQAERRERSDIKNDIYQSFTNSNILNAKQADSAATLAANMYQALADNIGVSVKDLYAKYRLNISQAKNDLNLSGKERAQDQRENVGWIDPETLSIFYKPNAKISTVLHEIAHGFLSIYSKASKEYNAPKLNKMFEGFNKAYGIKGDFSKLSAERQAKIQEQFVAHFLQSFFNGNTASTIGETALMVDFRKFLSSAFRRQYGDEFRSLKARIQEQGGNADPNLITQSLIANEYARAAGEDLPQFNEEVGTFIQGMLWSEDMKNQVTQDLIDEPILNALIENGKLTPEQIEEIRELETQYKGLEVEAQKGMDNLIRFMVNASLKTAKNIDEIKAAFKAMQEGVTDEKWLKQVDGYLDRFMKIYNARLEEIKNAQTEPIVQALKNIKLDKQDAKRRLPQDVYKRLAENGRISNTDLGGYSIDMIKSEFYNTRNPRFLQKDLYMASARPEDYHSMAVDYAYNRVNQEVLNGNVYDSTVQALTIDLRRKLGQKEMSLLKKITGNADLREARAEIYDRLATYSLSQTSYKDINPGYFTKMASKARGKAQQALAKGDVNGAYKALELEQAYLAKANLAATFTEEMRQRIGKLQKFATTSKGRLANRFDMRLVSMARALMAQIGLYDRKRANAESIQVREFNPDVVVKVQELFKDPRFNTYWQNLSLKDLNEIINALFSLRAHASYLKRLNVEDKQVQLNTAAKDICDSLAKNPHTKQRETITVDGKEMRTGNLPPRSLTEWIKDSFFKHIGKVESICKYIDGQEDGPFTQYIYRPLRKAYDEYQIQKRYYFDRLNGILDGFHHESGIIDGMEDIGMSFGVSGEYKGAGKFELLGFCLHMGNAYNFNALCKGYGFTPEQFSQFFQHQIDKGIIDENFMDTLQDIWNLNKEVSKYAQKAYYQINGSYFKEQENRPIVTPWKTYSGGYVPLKRNRQASFKALQKVIPLQEYQKYIVEQLPEVNNSWTIERNGGFNDAPVYDVYKLEYQIDEVLRYGFMQPTIEKIQALLTRDDVATEMARTFPNMYRDVFAPWLRDVANNSTSKPSDSYIWINSVINWIRRNTGAAIMCANFNNTLQSVTSISQAASRVSPTYLAIGFNKLISHPIQAKQDIRDLSKMMNVRLDKMGTQVRTSAQFLAKNPNFFHGKEKAKANIKKIQQWNLDHAYFMQKFAQDQIDTMVWWGAYQEHFDKYQDQQKAIDHADSVIRTTQMSFDPIDLSNTERGGALIKAITQFGGYFYTLANLTISEWKIAGQSLSNLDLFIRRAYVLFTTFLIPAILADAINKIMSGAWWNEDEEGWKKFIDCLLGSQVRTVAGAVPIFGTALNTTWNNFVLDKNYYTDSYLNVPSLTTASALAKGVTRFIKDGGETEWSPNLVRNIWQGTSIMTGLPTTAPAGRYASYLYGIYSGEYAPTSGWDLARGLLTARASEASKN